AADADRIRVRRVRPALLPGDTRHLRFSRAQRDSPARTLRRVDLQRDGGLRARGPRGGRADRRGVGEGEGMTATAPHVSIVIPVYNEEGILRGSVLELEEKLRRFGWSYELLLCENGSRDRTIEIGRELEAEHPHVRMLSVGEPNYGLAMRQGILEARGRYVICDEIDLLDTEFYARAMALLERSDTELVVGSKAMVGSNDQRPLFRRAATRVYNGMLRAVCRYPGTDTHGLKAFRREALLETARRCRLDRDVFASEFVIRAHREGKKVVEIPFAVREKRPPSIRLMTRVPHVLSSVAKLAISVRRNPDSDG